MIDPSTLSLLVIVNAYVLLALSLFALSVRELFCRVRQGKRCVQQQRLLKFIIAVPLMLSCLALLATGLFAIGISHGSRPENYQVILFIFACLAPFVLLIIWIAGSLWVDVFWLIICTAVYIYLSFINPAIYVRYWADDNHQWAQIWIAGHYETGSGGLRKSKSTAHIWYKKAAINGNPDAQYKTAQNQRRGKNARKWYLMAAEQGHPDAMIQVARLSNNKAERKIWLNRAADKHHPEAIFILSQDAMKTDLPAARQLLIAAADKGSRSAIIFLISQYQYGGILFAQDPTSARQWQAILKETPASDSYSKNLTTITINPGLKSTQGIDQKIKVNEAVTLYQQAQIFLHHPAKDQPLHKRAIEYLTRAAQQGHGEAAVELAKLASKKSPSKELNKEAVKWYEIAAVSSNTHALKQLVKYYKEKPEADISDLSKSLEFNEQLLTVLDKDKNRKRATQKRFLQQHWSSEYRDTQKKLAQLKRLGGSWQTAIKQAEDNPQKEYLLAKEMLDSRQYSAGMQRMKSAAQRGSSDARYELARRTLNGPRSFTQEVDAITELQTLDQINFAAASIRLGSLYQSGTGVVPKNLYLARQLFRKSLKNSAQADTDLSKKAYRLLERTPDFTDSLAISSADDAHQKITAWYEQEIARTQNPVLLEQQYRALLEHFRDTEQLKLQAADNDAEAQYQLAQSLQSRNLAEAMQWLQRAAKNGNSNAQYELSIRMIRGKRNPPETKQDLKKWAVTAAQNGHAGAMIFIANQFKNGTNGFRKNTDMAKEYYLKALQSTDTDIIYRGNIAGRSINVKRAIIEKKLAAMNPEMNNKPAQ